MMRERMIRGGVKARGIMGVRSEKGWTRVRREAILRVFVHDEGCS